ALRERSAELGIMLLPGARGRSYARAAMLRLMMAAFEALSIDMIWVQYRPANVAAARLFAELGFSRRASSRPRRARSTQCVRFMQRATWYIVSNQPARGVSMSNIIGFLENVGRDAALRYVNRERLAQAMQCAQLLPEQGAVILSQNRSAIDSMFHTENTMY